MNRRKFISGTVLATLGVGVIAFFSLPSLKNVVKKILKEDLEGLKVDEEEINSFLIAADKANVFSDMFYNWKKRDFFRGQYLLDNAFFKLPYKNKYLDFRAHLVSIFLLSSSFFLEGMDEQKEIKFLSIYSPYTRPCSNPFSSLYYSNSNN